MSEPAPGMEAKLRILMNIAAGEPTRRITAEDVRRAVARRRMGISVSAAAAMVLICGVGVAIAAPRGGHLSRPASGTRPASTASATASNPAAVAGVPRYYVAQTLSPTGYQTTVRARTTGAVRARVRCPWRAANVVESQVASANHQTFFLVCQRFTGRLFQGPVLSSRIYRFHVTDTGRISGYVLVRGGSLSGLRVRDISTTADSSEIAVIVLPGRSPDRPKLPADVLVINTATGVRAVWHAAGSAPGKVVYYPEQISLTAGGHDLVFRTIPQCFQPPCTLHGGEQMRVASPAANGGQLNNTRVLVRLSSVAHLSAIDILAIKTSPDGSMLTLAVANPPSRRTPGSVSVVQIPATGEHHVRRILRMVTGNAYQFLFFSADSSGRHFLLGAGGLSRAVAGWIRNGRIIPLKPSANSATSQLTFEIW